MTAVRALADGDEISEQIVVVRLPSPDSEARVRHARGDAVALLEVIRPPAGLVKTLAGQAGRYFLAPHRRSVVGDRAVVALELSSSAVEISTKRVEETPAIILTIGPRQSGLHPDHRALFGAMPGLFEIGRLPIAVPSEPADAPCPARIANDRLAWSVPAKDITERFSLLADPVCAEFLAAQLAVESINSGRSLAPFERWAFNFEPWRQWPEHRRAHSIVSLVVGGVLTRTGYEPEAEVVLAAPDLFKARSLRHHQALGLAHLELTRGRSAEVRSIVEPLLETGAPDEIKALAGIVLVLSETRRGAVADALVAAGDAWDGLRAPEGAAGPLAALAGEVALASDQHTQARSWFERAASSSHPRAGRAAKLRLADFAARRGEFRKAKRILARVRPETACEVALVELREKVMALAEADAVLRLLENIVKQPTCPAEAREARFALAQTYVQVGLPELAVPLAWQLRDELPRDYRHTNEPFPVLERAFRSAAARLARHRRWQELTVLYEENVAEKRALELLDGPTLVHVARAYIESGAPQSGSTVLTLRLARGVSKTSRLDITLTLIETYLRSNDAYRADLVLDHFEKIAGPKHAYEVSLNRARLALLDGRPAAALELMRELEPPAGDPTQQRLEIIARAHLALGQPFPAADAYLASLNLPIPAESEHPEDIVRVLSACARAEVDGPCGALYRTAATTRDLGPRLDAHARRLGWVPSDGGAHSPTPSGLAEMLVRSSPSEAREDTE
jgi:hypothetical protein